MAASSYILKSGVWKQVSDVNLYTGSAWKDVTQIYYWNGSAWVESFTKGFVFSKTLSGTTTNFNVATEATAQGWNGVDSVIANITLATSAIVRSSSINSYAFDTVGLVANSTVNLTVGAAAYIVGLGGTGAMGSFSVVIPYPQTGYSNGAPGGPAMNILSTINMSLTNNGTIGGGGGGGGGGNGGETNPTGWNFQGGSGGGGAGFGSGGPITPGQPQANLSGPAGGVGTLTTGGAGVSTIGQHSSRGGLGGNGGNLGSTGNNGLNNASAGWSVYQSAGAGGPAGVAINGWSNITVVTQGSILGAKNN